jgi:predicted phage baseplate assembly protein
MPARGGMEPEKLSEMRRNIPEAFKTQERAVTESDYTDVLKRHPDIQRASASIRWTGSWYTVYVTVDRYEGRLVDERFKNELRNFLDKYRLAGYDVEISEPLYVPLEISLSVCAAKGYLRDQVRRALLEAFSNRRNLASEQPGFFHPDNFTFGQPVLLSKIYETAMRVDGVVSVVVNKFRRFHRQLDDGIEVGVLRMGATEVARLDNDPNFPENGRISVTVEGGR